MDVLINVKDALRILDEWIRRLDAVYFVLRSFNDPGFLGSSSMDRLSELQENLGHLLDLPNRIAPPPIPEHLEKAGPDKLAERLSRARETVGLDSDASVWSRAVYENVRRDFENDVVPSMHRTLLDAMTEAGAPLESIWVVRFYPSDGVDVSRLNWGPREDIKEFGYVAATRSTALATLLADSRFYPEWPDMANAGRALNDVQRKFAIEKRTSLEPTSEEIEKRVVQTVLDATPTGLVLDDALEVRVRSGDLTLPYRLQSRKLQQAIVGYFGPFVRDFALIQTALGRLRNAEKLKRYIVAEQVYYFPTEMPTSEPPVWNGARRELRFSVELLLCLAASATVQCAILDACETAGWPRQVPIDLRPDGAITKVSALRDGIKNLNGAQDALEFKKVLGVPSIEWKYSTGL